MNLAEARKFVLAHSHDAGRFPMGKGKKPAWSPEMFTQWQEAWELIEVEVKEQRTQFYAAALKRRRMRAGAGEIVYSI